MIIGHSKQKTYFLNVLKNNNLSQGYIFIGQDHLGKFSLAKKLAYNILFLDNQKDFLNLENKLSFAELKKMDLCSDYAELTGEEEIKISDIRDIKNKVLCTSFGASKVFIIKKIERINVEAGNALLKILEEPQGDTHFIFTSACPGSIMPTIFSRLISVYFNPLKKEEIKKHLLSITQNEARADTLARLSGGQIGVALNFLKDPKDLENFESNVEKLKTYLKNPFWKRIVDTSQDNKMAQGMILDWMRFLEYILRSRFLSQDILVSASDYWKNLDINKLKNTLEKIHNIWNLFSQTNANKKILFEELVLNLPPHLPDNSAGVLRG
ncbi:MAG: polymerase III, delta' subunit protein [Parcubacteria group bacterium GW2011_GWA2_39_18]|nr:MAG: polymerase III, delta' subunit protein [Parcubacteria group bacterium GW2011_GWA2_39_18]